MVLFDSGFQKARVQVDSLGRMPVAPADTPELQTDQRRVDLLTDLRDLGEAAYGPDGFALLVVAEVRKDQQGRRLAP